MHILKRFSMSLRLLNTTTPNATAPHDGMDYILEPYPRINWL